MAIKNTLGDRRQFTIIEDTAVSIDHLYEYVIYLLSLYNKYDLQYVIYGHAGNGNLHTRPILDSRNNFEDRLHSKQASILKNITYKTFKKIFEYRGTITAEHGDGISRTPFIKNVYNNFVYSYFSYLKKSFDPLNLLNPGKKVPVIRSINLCFFSKSFGDINYYSYEIFRIILYSSIQFCIYPNCYLIPLLCLYKR